MAARYCILEKALVSLQRSALLSPTCIPENVTTMEPLQTTNEGATLYGYARQQKEAGVAPSTLTNQLIQQGMSPERAAEMVHSLYGASARTARPARPATPSSVRRVKAARSGPNPLTRTILAAAISALVAGLLWGFFARALHAVFGGMALAAGGIVALTTVMATPDENRDVQQMQLIACAGSAMAILIGYYATFWLLVSEKFGVTALYGLTPSGIGLYFENAGEIWTVRGIIWFALAVLIAYRIASKAKDI